MKKLSSKLMIVTLIMISASILSSSDAWALLQIYKVKGDVTVKSGNKEVNAKRRANVKATDMLNIPSGGSVEILDSDTHRIYSSTKTGRMTVKSLMKKAESQASNITRNINRRVMAAVADNAGSKRSGYDAIGMSIHETDAVLPTLIDIPEGMSYLSYLLSNPSEPDSAHQSFISLSSQLIEDEDGEANGAFNFGLCNSLNTPLYFNIVVRDEEKGLRFLFRRNPIVAPKSDTTVEEYTYLPDEKTQRYVAIASDHNFSIDDAKHLLDDDYMPKDNYYMTILTIHNQYNN